MWDVAAADKLGFPKSALIRMLIRSFVEHMDASGGTVTLPLQWLDDAPRTYTEEQYAAESTPPEYHTARKTGSK